MASKQTRIFVPSDTTARSVGADGVAAAISAEAAQRGIDTEVVRNGSRGLYWLEPLVEVEVDGRRLAYGPVTPADVPSLFDEHFLEGGAHRLALGETEAIPYLAKQSRLTFARVGIIDPLSIEEYRAHDGFRGLANAAKLDGAKIVEIVTESGLRGRGGAAVAPTKRNDVPLSRSLPTSSGSGEHRCRSFSLAALTPTM